ncbi:MAG: hypothetical protein IPK99_17820 [Flavobacteriales bacterium]|nr:hypothetical protein [Flavobacteriales bacterium]
MMEAPAEETTLAETLFLMLAVDDILFDEPLFKEICIDYRHASNLGTPMDGTRYASHDDQNWRNLCIDLLTDRHLLSQLEGAPKHRYLA